VSADLLRRAATGLRESALAATPGPWKVVYFGDRGYPQRVVDDSATLIAQTYEGRDTSDPVRLPAGSPEYIALVHPPVALALADWLDLVECWYPAAPHSDEAEHAVAVARAVLREPEGGDRT